MIDRASATAARSASVRMPGAEPRTHRRPQLQPAIGQPVPGQVTGQQRRQRRQRPALAPTIDQAGQDGGKTSVAHTSMVVSRLTPEFSCEGASVIQAAARDAARLRQLQRFVSRPVRGASVAKPELKWLLNNLPDDLAMVSRGHEGHSRDCGTRGLGEHPVVGTQDANRAGRHVAGRVHDECENDVPFSSCGLEFCRIYRANRSRHRARRRLDLGAEPHAVGIIAQPA
jgi:hypothetical protein